jgi:uncharacterized membrane-anchored protein YjiN (DUF445 family)
MPAHPPAAGVVKSAGLVRMQRIALGLLGGAAVLYALATLLQARHPAWGYVAAFAEAAMVGAIADWFAVVALFRHPLGLPIPHTAIIPGSKDRIGANLAAFIVGNFLGTAQVLEKLRRLDLPARLAAWLSDPGHARSAANHGAAVLRHALGAFDDERVRRFFRATVLDELAQVDVATVGGQLLDVLTRDQRHHEVLDALLRRLAALLDNETLKSQMAEVIASEVKLLRLVGLDSAAGRYATGKLVASVIRLIGDLSVDPTHPLRVQFDAYMVELVARLRDEAALRAKVEAVKRDLLGSPALSGYLQGLWTTLLGGIADDLGREDSRLRERTAAGVRFLGEKLASDAAMRAWLDEQIVAAAPRWIERYREDIRRSIVARVHEWNTEEMTRELERNIGRDLQFIRINGTLVGGLVGLLIHAATELARGL